MIIGKMDKRVKLQKPANTPDGQGGAKPTGTGWADVATVWAEFRTPNVKELAATGTIISDLIRQISIRRRTDIRRGWQVVYVVKDITNDATKDITKIFKVQHTFDFDMSTTVLVCQEVIR